VKSIIFQTLAFEGGKSKEKRKISRKKRESPQLLSYSPRREGPAGCISPIVIEKGEGEGSKKGKASGVI